MRRAVPAKRGASSRAVGNLAAVRVLVGRPQYGIRDDRRRTAARPPRLCDRAQQTPVLAHDAAGWAGPERVRDRSLIQPRVDAVARAARAQSPAVALPYLPP